MVTIIRKIPRRPRVFRTWLSESNSCEPNEYCDTCMDRFAEEAENKRPGHVWAVDEGKVIFLEDVVAEHNLGRKLKSTEEVVHKDGDPKNNTIDNLEVVEIPDLRIE